MILNRKSPLEAEWSKLKKQENAFLEKRSNKQEDFISRLLAEKVPEKLYSTLQAAFNKAFALVFEKGTAVIEKTYKKEQLENDYKANEFSDQLSGSKKTLRAFTRKSQASGAKNLLLSGVSGAGMGVLGIGLPDIPVFTAMIFRNIYQIALNYGFDYEAEQEKYFILLLICGALSYGEDLRTTDEAVNAFISREALPADYSREKQISAASSALAAELLCLKFVQGIPVVGAVGGIGNAVYMRRISQYADLKYRRRLYSQKIKAKIKS